MIQKMLYAGAAAVAMFAVAAPATAATTIKGVYNTYDTDAQTGSYGFTVSGTGSFTTPFTFDVGTLPGKLGVSISSISVKTQTRLDSLSVLLNGDEKNNRFNLTRTDGSDGSSSYKFDFIRPVLAGGQTLTISGSKSNAASTSISGTLNFTPAVPEPAAWAMMIGGFGLVGGTLRRRSQVRTSVRFA